MAAAGGVPEAALRRGAQALHASEVEERDGAVVVEQVVAGVGVGVEHAEAGDAPEEEAVDDLAPPVAQRLVGVVRLGPPSSVDHLHGEHPVAGQLGEHLGHADERMAAVVLGELHLVGQLGAVVELLADALRDLVGEGADVEVAGAGARRPWRS